MASMLNQAAVEALCSATYLENYLECMENLPDDLQRVVSNLRELDSQIKVLMQDIAHHKSIYMEAGDGNNKRRALLQIQRSLIKTQEIGDEKLQLVGIITDLIENRTRQLESDLENLDPGSTIPKKTDEPMIAPIASKPKMSAPKEDKPSTSSENKAGLKRQRRQRAATETKEDENSKKLDEKEKPKKKKKRIKKKEAGSTPSPAPELIDPNEPLYCLCRQISYGEMIGCDYDDCEIEWFHFNCVGLVNKPKGKWYCPNCRGDRPNVMRKGLKDHL